jgi:hypothetical protein
MVCDWCGLSNDAGNHATLEQCVEALHREVEALRRALARVTGDPSDSIERPPQDHVPNTRKESK